MACESWTYDIIPSGTEKITRIRNPVKINEGIATHEVMDNASCAELAAELYLVVDGLCHMGESQRITVVERIQADVSAYTWLGLIIPRVYRFAAGQIVQLLG